MSEAIAVLNDALESEFGIAIQFDNPMSAATFRRSLYAARHKVRQQGDDRFEGLSFVLTPDHEIRIIQREAFPSIPATRHNWRPLTTDDAPEAFNVRGPKKPGLGNILLHSRMEEEARAMAETIISAEAGDGDALKQLVKAVVREVTNQGPA